MGKIIEIHEWLEKQPKPYKDLDWNDWKNIKALLKPRIGKTLYTKSCWAGLHGTAAYFRGAGLFEATLYSESMTVKIGEKLNEEQFKKGYGTDDTYHWVSWNRIYVDEELF